MVADVRALVRIGPREAASGAYARAARLVADRFRGLGYTLRRQRVAVPSGEWHGHDLDAGTTVNVIAEPPGFDPGRAHLVVGGHLDTVPRSPGAYDNASGVAIVLELARLASVQPPRTPMVFVAFGAEERRRPGDRGHHYGSLAYVAEMDDRAEHALRGFVSIDAVGIGERLRLCTGGRSPRTLVRAFAARAARLGVRLRPCPSYAAEYSDHWSFEAAGHTVVWLWSGSHPVTHTPRDRFDVLERRDLARIGRLAWATLRAF